MNTIFDYLKDIIKEKKGNLITNVDDESTFVPFLVNRWLSMHSPQNAILVNLTGNQNWSIFNTKTEYYKYLLALIPQDNRIYISYIKKVKENVNKDEEHIEEIVSLLSNQLQLSKREIRMYIETTGLDLTPYKKILKS